jgi:hypothetical protein
MLEALPAAARAMVDNKYIDPAAGFLAMNDGLTLEEACSRARNEARSLGSSWPDKLWSGALVDAEEIQKNLENHGIWGADPLQILEAVEAAACAIKAVQDDKTRARAAAAEIREADTHELATVFGVTQRRAQQIKKKQLEDAIDSQQFVLFEEGEEE